MRGLRHFSSQPPIWRESRSDWRRRRCCATPDLPRRGRARTARGQPVLLIPGFLAGDDSLGADDALAAPHRPPHAQGRDPRRTSTARRRPSSGSRSGWRRSPRPRAERSRSSARAAAATSRRCSPCAGRTSCRASSRSARRSSTRSPSIRSCALQVRGRGRARHAGRRPASSSTRCSQRRLLRALLGGPARRLPERTWATSSVYSRSDGIVDWRACLDPAAEHVEIRASHCGMAVSRAAYRGDWPRRSGEFGAARVDRRGRDSGCGALLSSQFSSSQVSAQSTSHQSPVTSADCPAHLAGS